MSKQTLLKATYACGFARGGGGFARETPLTCIVTEAIHVRQISLSLIKSKYKNFSFQDLTTRSVS